MDWFLFCRYCFEKITSFSDQGDGNKKASPHDYSGSGFRQLIAEICSYIQTANYRACLYDKQSQQKTGSGQNNY